jgi:poly(3-hydroxyalkanoate) synthetase
MGELMTATHNFGTAPTRGTSATDTFKAALYLASATYNAATTAYSATGEVSGTGYTAGGVTVTAATAPTATNSSATAGVAFFTPSASITYTTVTLTTAFDAVLIYNSTQSNKAVAVYTFGSQTITAGTFTLTMPSNTTTTALLRLATT